MGDTSNRGRKPVYLMQHPCGAETQGNTVDIALAVIIGILSLALASTPRVLVRSKQRGKRAVQGVKRAGINIKLECEHKCERAHVWARAESSRALPEWRGARIRPR